MDVLISYTDEFRFVMDDIFAKTDAFKIVKGLINNAFINCADSVVLYASNDSDALRSTIDDVFINTDVLRAVIDDVFAKTDALRSVIAEEFTNNVLRFTIDALIFAIDDVFAKTDALRSAIEELIDVLKFVM